MLIGLGRLDDARHSTGVTSLSRTITMPVLFWRGCAAGDPV